jgi:hypothetical protein
MLKKSPLQEICYRPAPQGGFVFALLVLLVGVGDFYVRRVNPSFVGRFVAFDENIL